MQIDAAAGTVPGVVPVCEAVLVKPMMAAKCRASVWGSRGEAHDGVQVSC